MNAPYIPKRAEAGVVIGGHELVRRIGRGGMAEVWVARRALGRKGSKFVAVKLIADHYVGDERYTRMFRAEAELAAVLSHANIVQVFDEGEDDGRSYLVMEWVDGLNLLKLGAVLALLDDDDRRFRVTSYIMGQLLYALSYAHSITSFDGSPMGVVHRDVSPQNVLISNHGEVKLTDFGVAYHVAEESSGIHVKGKVRYMSPEQLSGKTRSPTVDLYAVGALLHELLDGRKFRGQYEDGQEMFTAVLSGTIPPLTRPAPPELDELRLRLLQPDPADRIQSAEEAVEWLKRFPGHGDARTDLTKLCSSLTGVVRPRAGPGQSSQVPMADRRTLQFKGKRGLAKPRVHAGGPGKPPPPPPSAAASAPRAGAGAAMRADAGRSGVRTNVTTAAIKTPSRGSGGAVISGHTEFVSPQTLPLSGNKQVVGAGVARAMGAPMGVPMAAPVAAAPAAAVSVAAAPVGAASAAASVAGAPMGAPVAAVPDPSQPIPVEVASQAPAYAVPQPVCPSPRPNYVPPQPSSPIPVPPMPSAHAAPAVVPPPHPMASSGGPSPRLMATERLSMSEGSGAGMVSSGTEVIDASMLVELTSGSGTDQEIPPQAMMLREGSDTTRDIQPRPSEPGVSKGVVVAGIVVGLVLVALMSTTITWWLFNKNKEDGEADAAAVMGLEEGSSDRAGSRDDGADEGGGDSPSRDGGAGEGGGDSPSKDDGDVSDGAAAAGSPATPGGADGENPVDPATAAGDEGVGDEGDERGDDEAEQDAAEQDAPEPGDGGAGAEPGDRSSSDEPEPKRSAASGTTSHAPKPTGKVSIGAFPGMEGAQIRIGGTVLTIPKSNKVNKKLTVGKKKVAWRPNTSSTWKSAGSVTIRSGSTVTYFLSPRGLVER